jgi:hypothetical protein
VHPRGDEPRPALGGLSNDARIEPFPLGENRFPGKLSLAECGWLTDANVLVEHENG